MHRLAFCLAILASKFITNDGSLYNPNDVISLTSKNFQREVISSQSIWIVEFYAPWCGHCQQLVPEYIKVCNKMKGLVKCGGVDADSQENQQIAGEYNVKGFPTIKIFGKDKKKPIDYNGGRTADAIINTLRKVINDFIDDDGGKSSRGKKSTDGKNGVVELTDANFEELVLNGQDPWLVEFFAPWCGHCKNLAPEWEKAAIALKGKVKLGALDATQNQMMASRYKVQGYPTIKYFPAGPKDEPEEFDGGRRADDIIAWAESKFADSVPAPELKQITNEDTLKEACDKNKLCIIAFLPNILDCQSKCRNDYLNILKSLGAEFKKSMLGWLWTEASQQPEIEKALDIGGFGYPAMVAVNSKKKIYTTLRGPFSESGIREFIRDINYGKAGTSAPVRDQFERVHDLSPWDGKDGKILLKTKLIGSLDLGGVQFDSLAKPPIEDDSFGQDFWGVENINLHDLFF